MADVQRRRASMDALRSKRRVEKTVSIVLPGDDGPEEAELLFRSIGSSEYDKLVTKYPPTVKQKAEGLTYDIDRFAPALISRVCADPEMSEEEAGEIWHSGEWNRGEIMNLFMNAIDVCTSGMQVGPTASD